jgi:hypothetical protein
MQLGPLRRSHPLHPTRPFAPVRALATVGVALLALSCELVPVTVRVEVELPQTPVLWRETWGEASYEVHWTAAGDGEPVAGSLPAGSRVTVEIPRRSPVAVRAVPVWDGSGPAGGPGEPMAIAGALWPAGSESVRYGSNSLVLSFRDGPAAQIVHRLHHAGVDLRGFNAARLLVEIRERLPDDPWAIDLERIVQAVGTRSMRASYIRAPELHETGLVAPPGRWLPCSPFSVPTSGGERWPPLPVGVSSFHSDDGQRWVVDVDADGRGWQPGTP